MVSKGDRIMLSRNPHGANRKNGKEKMHRIIIIENSIASL
jgi:hypothetical protein